MIADLCASAEVAREDAIRAAHRRAAHNAAYYREWMADGAHKSGRVDPMEAMDAAHECGHGWLPHDHLRDCSCWGPPRVTTTTKETPMIAEASIGTREAREAEREEEIAPFGRKADGTPRKRPAPTPATIAKQRATRKARMKLASPPAAGATSETPAVDTVSASLLLNKVIDDIDTEIALLVEARAALAAVAA